MAGEVTALIAGISNRLMSAHRYRTMSDTGAIYVYDRSRGIYTNGAEWNIKLRAHTELGPEHANIHNVQEVLENIRRSGVVPRSQFDSDPNLLCVGNGVLNLTTLELYPWDPNMMFLRRIGADYDPNADCPTVKKFLGQVVEPNNIRRLTQLIGYLITPGYRYHKAFILVGTGDNGKDTFCHLLQTFLGMENCSNLTLQQMCNEKFQRPQLYGKMANIAPEMGSVAVRDTESLKSLTGESTVSVENKNEKPFTFINQAKMIFACNEIPPAVGADKAYYGRWIIIPFPYEFKGKKRDPELKDKLTTPSELSGMLNMALEGRKMLVKFHGFDYPDDYEGTRMLYQAWSGSTIDRFMATQLVQDIEGVISKRDLYSEYRSYCTRLSKVPETETMFFTKFGKLTGFDILESHILVNGERIWVVKGIKFKKDVAGTVADTIPYTISIHPQSFIDDEEEEPVDNLDDGIVDNPVEEVVDEEEEISD